MGHLWDPEQLIGPNDALRMIISQFPEINPTAIELLGAGWDNTAYLINHQLVFRFPRRQIAVPMIETEAQILPILANHLSIPIPNPKWVGKADGSFPWPFIGYPILKGTTACFANLSDAERVKLARPLAKILKTLHSIPVTESMRPYLPGDDLKRMVLKNLVERSTTTLTDLKEIGLIEDIKPFLQALEASSSHSDREGSAIVHGDLYVRHLLVNQDKELAGVIDWGDLHFGTPAVDLPLCIASFLPAPMILF